MILEATAISAMLGMTAVGVHFTTRHGLLHWMSIWLLYTRAALLFAKRELARVPERWRQQYPMALRDVRSQGL